MKKRIYVHTHTHTESLFYNIDKEHYKLFLAFQENKLPDFTINFQNDVFFYNLFYSLIELPNLRYGA